MTNYDKKVVTPLLRRRAHLEEVGADAAKLAELDHMLEMAGYPAHKDSSLDSDRVEAERPVVPRAEHENPPGDPPHDDDETPRDDQAKTDEKAVAAKEKMEKSGPEGERGEPGKPDSKKLAEEKAGNTEGSSRPGNSEDDDEKKARKVKPKERSAKPKPQSSASKDGGSKSDDEVHVSGDLKVSETNKDGKPSDVSGKGGLTLPKTDSKG